MDDCSGDSMVLVRQSSVSSQDNSLACVKCFDPSGFAMHCHIELIGEHACSSLGLIMEQILQKKKSSRKS